MMSKIQIKVEQLNPNDPALVPIAALLEVNNRLFSIVNNSNKAIKDLMDKVIQLETNAFAKKVKTSSTKPIIHRVK